MSSRDDVSGPASERDRAIAALAGMEPDQLAETKRYGKSSLICSILGRILGFAFLLAFVLLAANPLDQWLTESFPTPWLRLLIYFGIMSSASELVSLPLSYYSGFALEHRYGMSTQNFGQWLYRRLKETALGLLLGAFLISGLFQVIWHCGHIWWMVAAGLYFIVSIVLGQLAPVLILPLFYKIERLEQASLLERMGRLADGTGLTIEGVYRMSMSDETVKANAMLTGLGKTRRVILGDTLLDQFDEDEIEVIFAHEVGHHVFRHIPKMILAGIWYSLIGFWACNYLLVELLERQALDYPDLPVSSLPLILLVLTVYFQLLEPLQNYVSRGYEVQCDRYALKRTADAKAYISSFQKLAKLNKADPDPHPLEVFLMHGHPPIARRLAIALPRPK